MAPTAARSNVNNRKKQLHMNARTETFKALLFLDAILAQHAADETMKWKVGWHRLYRLSPALRLYCSGG